jgi:hypothetical protein
VSSGAWRFRDNHLTRALKAAKKAGFCVNKATISSNGEIVLMFGNDVLSNGNDNDNDTPNPWDQVYVANQKRPT